MSNQRTKKAIFTGIAALAASMLFPQASGSHAAALHAQLFLTALTGESSFVFAESILIALVSVLSFCLAAALGDMLRGRFRLIKRFAAGFTAAAVALTAGYCVLWQPIAKANRLECSAGISKEDLTSLTTVLGRKAAALWTNDLFSPEEAAQYAAHTLSLETGLQANIKISCLPEMMSAFHLAGVYVPYTGEALLNARLNPLSLPFVAAHEGAHQLGYGSEAEASYIAYRALTKADGPGAYCATLYMLHYALEALGSMDAALCAECAAALDPRVQRDVMRIAAAQSSVREDKRHDALQVFARKKTRPDDYGRVILYLPAQ